MSLPRDGENLPPWMRRIKSGQREQGSCQWGEDLGGHLFANAGGIQINRKCILDKSVYIVNIKRYCSINNLVISNFEY